MSSRPAARNRRKICGCSEGGVASSDQMEMSALFTLNELDPTIGDFRVGLAVQRHPDRKTGRGVFSNDLNAGNGVTSRPLPNRIQALFSECPVALSPTVLNFAMLTSP